MHRVTPRGGFYPSDIQSSNCNELTSISIRSQKKKRKEEQHNRQQTGGLETGPRTELARARARMFIIIIVYYSHTLVFIHDNVSCLIDLTVYERTMSEFPVLAMLINVNFSIILVAIVAIAARFPYHASDKSYRRSGLERLESHYCPRKRAPNGKQLPVTPRVRDHGAFERLHPAHRRSERERERENERSARSNGRARARAAVVGDR